MAGFHEADNTTLSQIDIESAELALVLKHLNERVSNLSVFEQAVVGRAAESIALPEPPQVDEDLHKKIDLFTHFKSCSHRRRMSKFDRMWQAPQKCKACYNTSLTMGFESWQPNDHHITLQRFPAMAIKEARAWNMVQMGPVGPDGTCGRIKKASRKRKREHMSNGVDTESEILPSPLPRPIFLRGSEARRQVLVRENPSDADASANDEEGDAHDIEQGNNDGFKEDDDGAIRWNEDDDTGMDILSADMAVEGESSDHEESYKESSSPVKAWYMHPGSKGNTP